MPGLHSLVFPRPPRGRFAIGLLVLRLVVGFALVLHGLDKIREPMTWMGADSWAPAPLQLIAALTVLVGGLALMVGLFTPLASLFVAGFMVVAIVSAHIPDDPFIRIPKPDVATEAGERLLGVPRWLVTLGGEGGSWESAALYLAVAFLLMLTGPGVHSLDARLGARTTPG